MNNKNADKLNWSVQLRASNHTFLYIHFASLVISQLIRFGDEILNNDHSGHVLIFKYFTQEINVSKSVMHRLHCSKDVALLPIKLATLIKHSKNSSCLLGYVQVPSFSSLLIILLLSHYFCYTFYTCFLSRNSI